jgi:hypothetical protein
MTLASDHFSMLISAFAEISGCTAGDRPGLWELSLPAGARVQARVVDSWLVMTSPVAMAGQAARLLDWNAILPAWLKFALSENDRFQARAELPIDAMAGYPAMIREAWQGFQVALGVLCGKDSAPPRSEPLPPLAQSALISLCEEAGWKAVPRENNAVAVGLECPGAFHQATFAPCAGGLRAAFELTAAGTESKTEAGEAVTRFLLAAGAGVRMVRPVTESISGKAVSQFEFLFSATPTAALLAHTFSALSTASRLAAEEVKALQNTDVARDYLALRRMATKIAAGPASKQKKEKL